MPLGMRLPCTGTKACCVHWKLTLFVLCRVVQPPDTQRGLGLPDVEVFGFRISSTVLLGFLVCFMLFGW